MPPFPETARPRILAAGGFIGFHLVNFLKEKGYWVRGVDIKEPKIAPTSADEFELLDLRRWEACQQAAQGVEHVYALAAEGVALPSAAATAGLLATAASVEA